MRICHQKRSIAILAKDQDKIETLLLEIIKTNLIQENDGQPPSEDEIAKETSDVKLLEKMKECFEDFFLFLWSASQKCFKTNFVQTVSPVINRPSIQQKSATDS